MSSRLFFLYSASSSGFMAQSSRGSLVLQPNQPSSVLPSNRAVKPVGGFLWVWAGSGAPVRRKTASVKEIARMERTSQGVGKQGGRGQPNSRRGGRPVFCRYFGGGCRALKSARSRRAARCSSPVRNQARPTSL